MCFFCGVAVNAATFILATTPVIGDQYKENIYSFYCGFHFFLEYPLYGISLSFHLQYDGELYLLATDQGYINQPDLVWEKLNEVKLSSQLSSLLREMP